MVVGRWGGDPEELQLYRSWIRSLLKSKCFSNFRKVRRRQIAANKHFAFSELQNKEKGMLGESLIESIPKTCRGMLWCPVPPAMLSHTQVVKHTEVSMFSSFLQGMLHTVRPSRGKALEAKERSKVKAVHGTLVALLLHLKIPKINKLIELPVGMKIQAQA